MLTPMQEFLLRGLYAKALGAVCAVPKTIGGDEIAEASPALSPVAFIGEDSQARLVAPEGSVGALDYEHPLIASGRVTAVALRAASLPIGDWEY